MRQFKERTVERLRGFAPKHFLRPGETAVRNTVDFGVEQALAYGLTAESAIRLYIEMMFILGSGFDKDPMFPWAGEILNDAMMAKQYDKTNRLYDELSVYLSSVLGKSNEFYERALRRIWRFTAWQDDIGSAPLEEYIISTSYKVYPEKFAYVGETAVRKLANGSARVAETYGVAGDHVTVLLAFLMYLLGNNVLNDPLHPWVAESLAPTHSSNSDERVERLSAAGIRTLEHCLL
jgi:hypothetical protein